MDAFSFDTLVRLASSGISRRGLVKHALVPAVAGLGAATLLGVGESEAKKKKKRCKKAGASCKSNKQCCPGKTHRICEVPSGGGNSDTVCCGGEGAKCGGNDEEGDDLAPLCCVGFECSSEDETPGACLPVL